MQECRISVFINHSLKQRCSDNMKQNKERLGPDRLAFVRNPMINSEYLLYK